MAEKKVSRLRFTKNELTDEKVRRAAAKAERAADRAETAQAKLPKKVRLRFVREGAAQEASKEAAGVKTPGSRLQAEKPSQVAMRGKLRVEKVESVQAKPGKSAQAGRNITRTAVSSALDSARDSIGAEDDDNAGVQAMDAGESSAHTAGSTVRTVQYSHKLKTFEKAERLVEESDRANVEALYQQAVRSNPEASSNPISRWRQRQEIRKEYVAAKRAGNTGAAASRVSSASGTAHKASGAVKESGTLAEKAAAFVQEHSKGILVVLVAGLLLLTLVSAFSSCTVFLSGSGQTMLGTSYTAEVEDIRGTDGDYTALETALQDQIDNIETSYPGYDEYRYDLEDIGHDPYELAAYLTILYEDYTQAEVQSALAALFSSQYTLTVEQEVEVRTRIETRTGTRTVTDPVTHETTTETYEYDVEVEYDYYILNVTLTNKGIDDVVRSSGLEDDVIDRYDVLKATHGNRDGVFDEEYPPSPDE